MGKKGCFSAISLLGLVMLLAAGSSFAATAQMEKLGRGLSVANAGTGVFLSWRLLGTDPTDATFTLYRDGTEIARIAGCAPTSYLDASGSVASAYTLKDSDGNVSSPVIVLENRYKDNYGEAAWKSIQLDRPASLTMPDGSTCSYLPNDMSVGDLDGDGEYELILKWDPTNSKDNASDGYTGNVYIDAYRLDGTKLWRIDMGKNIRAGAHYTQMMVYDLDGDGIAEIALKTSDGTVDGKGKVIGDANADYRTSAGRILSGNEYLTVFSGKTGEAITTIDYVPGRGATSAWGDNYGNRSERMLAAIAYLDGVHPSLVMCRGYYAAAYMVAFDFDGKTLRQRWMLASTVDGSGIFGEGNHNLSVGDLDGDGRDEIVFGSAAVNPDGTLRYRTGFGHGDAMHLSDMDPDSPGLEVYAVHEEKTNKYAEEFRDPSGNVIWGTLQTGVDNGRGLAADIDSTSRGFEMWSTTSGGIRTVSGNLLSSVTPSYNFRLYWDGDLQDELLDATGSGGSGGKLEKWNSSAQRIDRILNLYKINNSTLNNYTKANPCLSADIFGDFREEIIARNSADSSVVNIIATLATTPHRVYTLMHDRQYRLSVAWQNVAYNQPPHLGYFLPDKVGNNLTKPDISVIASGKASSEKTTVAFASSVKASEPDSSSTGYVETEHAGTTGENYWNFANESGAFTVYRLNSESAHDSATLAIVYANGGNADRQMEVSVGNEIVLVSFPPTGWDTWDTALVTVRIPEGDFSIALSSKTSDGGPNISMIAFDVAGISQISSNGGTTALERKMSRVASYDVNFEVLHSGISGIADVSVFDVRGNRVRSFRTNVHVGDNSVSLGKENLSAGIYYVKVLLDLKPVAIEKLVHNP